MPLLQMEGRSIYWRSDGDPAKAPLVLLNSLGTHQGLWDILMPDLLQDFYVLRMDKRGHGGSTVLMDHCSIEELSQDVLAVLDHVQWPKTDLCGISIGGMMGMWLGAYAPGRFKRLVLSNTSSKVPPESFNDRIAKIQAGGMASISEMVLSRFFTPSFVQKANPWFHSIRQGLLQTLPMGYIACATAVRDMDLREVLPRLTNESLVIIGEHDQSTIPSMGQHIAQTIPGARTVVMPLAHIPLLEDPAGYVKIMREFLLRP
jgi:3-oxoadipate enol-lactonase